MDTMNAFINSNYFSTGEALSCYECNSHNDSACAKDIPPVSSKIDCSTKTEGPKYNLCRKIVQFIDFEVNNSKFEIFFIIPPVI